MKTRIRVKLTILLVLVALLPLLGALVLMTLSNSRLRLENIRSAFLTVATSQAESLKESLARDIEQLMLVLARPDITAELATRTRRLSEDENSRLDDLWENGPEEAQEIQDVIHGPGADALRRLLKTNERLAEIFFTDYHGQLVAATGRTSDFLQSDESWWKLAFDDGKGRVAISRVYEDKSSHVWSVGIGVPVYHEGRLVGVAKAVSDISHWLTRLQRSVGEVEASLMLVSHEGKVILREGIVPLTRRALQWEGAAAKGEKAGFRVTENGEVQAYAPVRLVQRDVGAPVRMSWWSLVLHTDEARVLGSVYRLSMETLAAGLAGILVLFLGGLYLFDRYITRRILRIAQAARRVARGDLAARVAPSRGEETGDGDEISELSRDFNRMLGQIQRAHEQLEAANTLKTSFIRVAGHELRTPVSYIIAMARLLKEDRDPERLAMAVQSMGAKADRLNKITREMLQLMPEGILPQTIHCEEIEVSALLNALRSEVKGFLQQRRQTLVTGAHGVERVWADREKLLDILENLLTNAIQFTPDGGEVKVTVEPNGDNEVLFTVTDRGKGIPPQEVPHLFEPFFSGGDTLKHSTGTGGYQKRGIGLGLAIVKYFVDLHHGRVAVSSSEKGSVFSVTIPRKQPEERPADEGVNI